MTITNAWQQLPPRRGALGRLAPVDRDVWAERLDFDRERAVCHQSGELTAITEAIRKRALATGAKAVVLSGSTARGHRTRVSDLDYHVIGASSCGSPICQRTSTCTPMTWIASGPRCGRRRLRPLVCLVWLCAV